MIIHHEAKTQAQMFEIYKGEIYKGLHVNDGYRWRDWMKDKWKESIAICQANKFKLLPIGYRTKKPQTGFKWSKMDYSYEEALDHAIKGFNLAIMAGPSKIVMLDYDSHDIDQRLATIQTLTILTPRGLCFLARTPYDDLAFDRLKEKYPKFDTPRVDIMYALAPLSITCIYDVKGRHQCQQHDYRVREWIKTENLISFKDFVDEAIG